MFLAKKHIHRRTFLRGMGATIALPLLDAMIPARSLLAAAAARPVPRLAFVYFPHGAIMAHWTPAAVGRDAQLGRILEPLTPFQSRLTIVGGLENRHAYGPVHAITPGTWLSGTSPRASSHSRHGQTADQLAADHLGQDAPLASMTVASEEPKAIGAGVWEGEYDASYGTTISFRRAREPLPMEFRPRAVFDTLFHATRRREVRAVRTPAGDPTVARRETRAPGSPSVLDLVAADAARLRHRLGPADRVVLGEYLETIREVERRVDEVERRRCSDAESRRRWATLGEHAQAEAAHRFTERMALMFDMIALAFRADVTRVATVMMAAEASSMTYDHLGVPDSFHLLSHHQNDPEKIEKLVRIQTFHTRMFATFVRRLAELPEGDGSILDHSLVLFGSNMSNSHAHDHFPLPLAVVGGGCGTHRGGQHLRCPDHTPMANLLLTMLHRSGVPVETFGDSTCECAEL